MPAWPTFRDHNTGQGCEIQLPELLPIALRTNQNLVHTVPVIICVSRFRCLGVQVPEIAVRGLGCGRARRTFVASTHGPRSDRVLVLEIRQLTCQGPSLDAAQMEVRRPCFGSSRVAPTRPLGVQPAGLQSCSLLPYLKGVRSAWWSSLVGAASSGVGVVTLAVVLLGREGRPFRR